MNQFRKIALLICALALMVMVPGSIAGPVSDNRELMVLFTHDLHSYFLPHRVLTEQGNQMQQGGYAKLAYLIKGEQILQRNKIIVVDAGDFSMGTLFHTSLLQEASELRLMGKMGYDVGNVRQRHYLWSVVYRIYSPVRFDILSLAGY